MSGLRAVLAAVADVDGSTTVEEISARTGLEPELVRVALHQLVELGVLGSQTTSLTCPTSGCGGCASAAATCGTSSRGGLIALTPRPSDH